MLPVVDFDAVDLERRRAAAEKAAALEELDVRAGLFEAKRRATAGEPRRRRRLRAREPRPHDDAQFLRLRERRARSQRKARIALDLLEQLLVDAGHRLHARGRTPRNVAQHLVARREIAPRSRDVDARPARASRDRSRHRRAPASGMPKRAQLVLRQIDALHVDGVFAHVAQDVRELQRQAEIVGTIERDGSSKPKIRTHMRPTTDATRLQYARSSSNVA